MNMKSDGLSSTTHDILQANPDAYGLLLAPKHTPVLATKLLAPVSPDQLIEGPVQSTAAASAMLAGLWLWHDALEESHAISQKLENPDGSYWHAILHRREGDFSNGKYWLARCRMHGSFACIASELPKLKGIENPKVQPLMVDGWNPAAFVDLCEKIERSSLIPSDPLRLLAVEIQRLEWRCLFDYCAQSATPARA